MSSLTTPPSTYGGFEAFRRFSVEEYQRMIRTGVLDTNDKVELLEGCVVLKMPRDPEHDGTIDVVRAALQGVLPAGWMLRVQQAVTLPDSQPEPDLAVVRAAGPRAFLARHPEQADLGLLVEIANTSLQRDAEDKARIYARAGVAAYWIVNLGDRRLEVFAQPSGPSAVPGFASRRSMHAGDTVPLSLDGVTVGSLRVDDLLP